MNQQNPNWRDRVSDLLQAARDVGATDQPPTGAPGTPQHRALFERYVARLEWAHNAGMGWWADLIDAENERIGDRDQAIERVQERRPVGPVAHGIVIAVVRSFWLECARLNELLKPQERVAPEDLILGWLVKNRKEDLAKFLSDFPFWPMGMDFNGKWV